MAGGSEYLDPAVAYGEQLQAHYRQQKNERKTTAVIRSKLKLFSIYGTTALSRSIAATASIDTTKIEN